MSGPKLPLGTRVVLRMPSFAPADGKTGFIVRHVRRRSFVYGVKLDKTIRVGAVERWSEVHARADEVEVIES